MLLDDPVRHLRDMHSVAGRTGVAVGIASLDGSVRDTLARTLLDRCRDELLSIERQGGPSAADHLETLRLILLRRDRTHSPRRRAQVLRLVATLRSHLTGGHDMHTKPDRALLIDLFDVATALERVARIGHGA